MNVIALVGGVEISDQMGTSEQTVVGVFSDSEKLEAAKVEFDRRFPTRRVYFKEFAVVVDQPANFPVRL